MFRKSLIAPLLAATAMALTVSPAYAGKADRAREAIAAAEAKIHTAEQMGSATDMPERTAEARAALARPCRGSLGPQWRYLSLSGRESCSGEACIREGPNARPTRRDALIV